MTQKQYSLARFILIAIAIIIIGLSFSQSRGLTSFLVIPIIMALSTLLKTRVDDQIVDERQQLVAAKASDVSFRILIPLLMITSLSLIISSGTEEFFYLKALGMILAYVTCVGLLLYLGTYWYVDKQTGGKEQ